MYNVFWYRYQKLERYLFDWKIAYVIGTNKAHLFTPPMHILLKKNVVNLKIQNFSCTLSQFHEHFSKILWNFFTKKVGSSDRGVTGGRKFFNFGRYFSATFFFFFFYKYIIYINRSNNESAPLIRTLLPYLDMLFRIRSRNKDPYLYGKNKLPPWFFYGRFFLYGRFFRLE